MRSESSIYPLLEINLTFASLEALPHTSIQSFCQCTSAARVLQSAFLSHHCNSPKISFNVPLVWNTERVIKVSKLWCIKVLTLLVILAWIQHEFWKNGILWYDMMIMNLKTFYQASVRCCYTKVIYDKQRQKQQYSKTKFPPCWRKKLFSAWL